MRRNSCLIWLCNCYPSQDPADVQTLIELKVLSDLFVPPVPIYKDKGNDFLLDTYHSENAAYKIAYIAFSNFSFLLTCTNLMNQPYSLLKSVVESAPVVQTLDSAVHRINHYYQRISIWKPNCAPGGGRRGGGVGGPSREVWEWAYSGLQLCWLALYTFFFCCCWWYCF